jgi:dTMP kinase
LTRRGAFIVFEGCDGSGKTTNITRLVEELKARGCSVTSTREPGGTAIGEKIRSLLLDRKNLRMSMRCEALLYAASRAQLVEETIAPAIARGDVVICERYYYSSLAYQAWAGGLDPEFVCRLNEWATREVAPDLVILLDVDPKRSLGRKEGGFDRIEGRALAYHEAVRDAYLGLAAADPARYRVIDGAQPVDTVWTQVWRYVREILADIEGQG